MYLLLILLSLKRPKSLLPLFSNPFTFSSLKMYSSNSLFQKQLCFKLENKLQTSPPSNYKQTHTKILLIDRKTKIVKSINMSLLPIATNFFISNFPTQFHSHSFLSLVHCSFIHGFPSRNGFRYWNLQPP